MRQEYKILTGNDACTLGALAAGMNFFAGYPITPATEIAELASELLPRTGGKFMQMEDELASMGAIVGAYAGCLGVELLNERSFAEAKRAAMGAMIGKVLGLAIKIGIGIAFLVHAFGALF